MKKVLRTLRQYAIQTAHQPGYRLAPILEHRAGKVVASHRWVSLDDLRKTAKAEATLGPKHNVELPSDVRQAVREEALDVLRGSRHLYLDQHAGGRIVVGGKGYPPVGLPVLDTPAGPLEATFHQAIEDGLVNGFTTTWGAKLDPARPTLTYSYYARGVRANGLQNGERIPRLAEEWLPQWEKHIDYMAKGATLGHVLNAGWVQEDHMERVHHRDWARRSLNPLGVERTVQDTLVLRFRDEEAAKEAALSLLEKDRKDGYLWTHPDLRLVGLRSDPPQGFGVFSQLTIPGSGGGFYTCITQDPAPEGVARRLAGHSHPVYLPRQWGEILGNWAPEDKERRFAAGDGPATMGGVRKLPDAHAFVTYVAARLGGGTPEEALRQALSIRDFYFHPEATLAGWGATLNDDPEEVYRRIVSLPPIIRQTGEVDEEEAKEYYRRLLGGDFSAEV